MKSSYRRSLKQSLSTGGLEPKSGSQSCFDQVVALCAVKIRMKVFIEKVLDILQNTRFNNFNNLFTKRERKRACDSFFFLLATS